MGDAPPQGREGPVIEIDEQGKIKIMVGQGVANATSAGVFASTLKRPREDPDLSKERDRLAQEGQRKDEVIAALQDELTASKRHATDLERSLAQANQDPYESFRLSLPGSLDSFFAFRRMSMNIQGMVEKGYRYASDSHHVSTAYARIRWINLRARLEVIDTPNNEPILTSILYMPHAGHEDDVPPINAFAIKNLPLLESLRDMNRKQRTELTHIPSVMMMLSRAQPSNSLIMVHPLEVSKWVLPGEGALIIQAENIESSLSNQTVGRSIDDIVSAVGVINSTADKSIFPWIWRKQGNQENAGARTLHIFTSRSQEEVTLTLQQRFRDWSKTDCDIILHSYDPPYSTAKALRVIEQDILKADADGGEVDLRVVEDFGIAEENLTEERTEALLDLHFAEALMEQAEGILDFLARVRNPHP
ncbi:hypothetical protein IAU59_007619 [Kwoniella sp. CBS 9459]